jgi:multidrug efflux pump subunit AcrB
MIKKFIAFAIDKPIINHILLVFMFVLSIFAYQNIPKEIFPPSSLDQIVITGGYAGTSADVLDKMAVKSIEDDLKNINEITSIDTTIQNGSFIIKADIKPHSDNQLVLGDVKDIISNIRRDLPSDMNEPVAKIVVHDYPLLLVAISSDKLSKEEMLKIADKLKSSLSSYKELSGIQIRGDADKEVQIDVDEAKLEAYGLSKDAFYRAISQISSIFPIGTLEPRGKHLFVSTINGEKSAKALGEIVLSIAGKHIKLKDIATVRYTLGDSDQISRFNGKQNISININKTKDGNAIALSKEIKKLLKTYSAKYPDAEFEAYTDTSIWIKNRLNLVSSNILFGLILVFLALLLSVDFKIALVVAMGIPVSFMITIVGADLMGYSLNMLTLLGALIALGMLVDEAIVVAENIYRHIEEGKSPRDAAIDGAAEMFPAVMTATLTTVFSFLPLLIMSGEMGMFMKVLPVMITILLLSSLFEAFYFLPLHAKDFYSMGDIQKHQKDSKSDFWLWFDRVYEKILGFLLAHKKISLSAIVIFIILSTVGMLKITKFQLFPEFDTTQIYITGKVNINNKLEDTEEYVSMIEQDLLKDINKTEVASITSIIGIMFNADQSVESGSNVFQIFINLHEKAPENFFDKYINPIFSLEYDGSDMIRTQKAQEIVAKLKKSLLTKYKNLKLDNGNDIFEEINMFVQQTGIVGHDIEIGIVTPDKQKMFDAIKRLEAKLHSINGVEDIANNAQRGVDELKLRVNEYGQKLGFSEGYISSTLRGLLLESEYSKVFDNTGLLRVKIFDSAKDNNLDIGALKIAIPNSNKFIRLDEVCDMKYEKSFSKIYKEDSQRIRSVTARVDTKKVLATEVMDSIKPLLDEFRKEGIKIVIKGEEKENKQMKKEMSQAALIAIFLIFISLVWMFNSLVLPLIIVSTIPLSIVGALAGSYIMGINLTMPGVMGIIGLAGVVVNDGLIMLDFIKGSPNSQEIINKASKRLRPIMLTSVTTVLGLSTLIFFASGQALIIQPMAVALGFGIAWATVLNLYYVPLMYAVIYRVKRY